MRVSHSGLSHVDAIGGYSPRFKDIKNAAGKLLNYYNPDDYALTSWKLDQAVKPTGYHGGAYIMNAYYSVNKGNVSIPLIPWRDMWIAATSGGSYPGFASTTYDRDSAGGLYRVTMTPTVVDDNQIVYIESARVLLNKEDNLYEMLAFGASSVVDSIGSIEGIQGVFDGPGRNLRDYRVEGNTKWSTQNTGHSAQF